MKSMSMKKRLGSTCYHTVVFVFACVMISPVIWMVMGSFKTTNEIFQSAQKLLPESFRLDNYVNVIYHEWL